MKHIPVGKGGIVRISANPSYPPGEHLLNGIDLRALGYECVEHVAGERATHVMLRKRG